MYLLNKYFIAFIDLIIITEDLFDDIQSLINWRVTVYLEIKKNILKWQEKNLQLRATTQALTQMINIFLTRRIWCES